MRHARAGGTNPDDADHPSSLYMTRRRSKSVRTSLPACTSSVTPLTDLKTYPKCDQIQLWLFFGHRHLTITKQCTYDTGTQMRGRRIILCSARFLPSCSLLRITQQFKTSSDNSFGSIDSTSSPDAISTHAHTNLSGIQLFQNSRIHRLMISRKLAFGIVMDAIPFAHTSTKEPAPPRQTTKSVAA